MSQYDDISAQVEAAMADGSSAPGGNGGWFGEFSSGLGDITTSIGGILPTALQFTAAGQAALSADARATQQATRRAAKAANRAERRANKGLGAQNVSTAAPLSGAMMIGGLLIMAVAGVAIAKIAKDS